MEVEYIERLPTAEEYIFLRQSVGWGSYEKNVLEESLPRSLYGVCCFRGDEIIGMGRVVGDLGLCFYVQDIIVVPPHQKEGYGTNIMNHIMNFISAHRCENSVVALMAAKGKEPFYGKFGFENRPSEKFGNGMHLLS
ncbi:MAG: GNAT family N-acetyltransferase [Spirochaetales bacterium]|nr:GNAT family N-acetyltransferase [Spirochaetales bacterium]